MPIRRCFTRNKIIYKPILYYIIYIKDFLRVTNGSIYRFLSSLHVLLDETIKTGNEFCVK